MVGVLGNFDFLSELDESLAVICSSAEVMALEQPVASLVATRTAAERLTRKIITASLTISDRDDFPGLLKFAETQRLLVPSSKKWLEALRVRGDAALRHSQGDANSASSAIAALHRVCLWFALAYYERTAPSYQPMEGALLAALESQLRSAIASLRNAEVANEVVRSAMYRNEIGRLQRAIEKSEAAQGAIARDLASLDAIPRPNSNSTPRLHVLQSPAQLLAAEQIVFKTVSFEEQLFVEQSLELAVSHPHATGSYGESSVPVVVDLAQHVQRPNEYSRNESSEMPASTNEERIHEESQAGHRLNDALSDESQLTLAPIGGLGWLGSSIGGAIAYYTAVNAVVSSTDEQKGGAILNALAGGFVGFLAGAIVGGIVYSSMKKRWGVAARVAALLVCAIGGSVLVQCGLALNDGLSFEVATQIAINAILGGCFGMAAGYVLAKFLHVIAL